MCLVACPWFPHKEGPQTSESTFHARKSENIKISRGARDLRCAIRSSKTSRGLSYCYALAESLVRLDVLRAWHYAHESVMRGYTCGLAPSLPLVSFSVSFAALRFLSLGGRQSGVDLSFPGKAFADRRQYLPWVQAVSLNEPLVERKPPRVMNLINSRATDHPTPISGG